MDFEIISANKIVEYINDNKSIIIDIRNPVDYYEGHIPTAINIPYQNFHNEKNRLPMDKVIILYCERGSTSIILSRDISKEGFNVKSIYGGINAYRGHID